MKAGLIGFSLFLITLFSSDAWAFSPFAKELRSRAGDRFAGGSRFQVRDGLFARQNASAILSAIPTSFNLAPVISVGRKVIPDANHPFIAPGPTDQRGGCPGLNLLANYGYLPRNGITSMTQLLYALEEGLGDTFSDWSVPFSLILIPMSPGLKMSIGGTDARTDGPLTFLLGRAPGLFSPETHNQYEIDGSLARDDAYFANGQTDRFNGSRWATWYRLAANKYNGTMPIAWNGDVRALQYTECRNSNPQCHWAVFGQLVFYLAQTFTSTVMPSAASNGFPGTPFSDSITQFFGIVKQSNGTFTRGFESLPHGPEGVWYRRTVPLTLAELAVTGLASLVSRELLFLASLFLDEHTTTSWISIVRGFFLLLLPFMKHFKAFPSSDQIMVNLDIGTVTQPIFLT
ncbi:hypothetical protein CROQUDRAFT_62075 [Cronartium quercuum f. sp. fusiforme G11]|uniref:Heme haloperoxidase family profile domain-containing protein n=1 Tax=Cronartium quercuum f. sp. fusiforme G11 TaxID=708437 RepID=A0A9P6NPD2_9BASI|nr:hypothetical protein CROQUDRAFT_62075 [Cronartium quercuum f. sp. fusiforme G11]